MKHLWVMGSLLAAAGAQAANLDVQVLDREGKPLADAVVILETSVPGARPAAKAEITIAQEQMKFVPPVSVAQLSTKVNFVNNDRWDHHVRGGTSGPGGVYLDASQGYAFRISGKAEGKPASSQVKTYAQTGPQLLGCHLHGSMRGFLYVTDSPWALVSNAEGKVHLSDLPAGPARLRVWHGDELVETPVQNLQVADGMAAIKVATQVQPRKAKKAPEPAKSEYGY